ncbi:hypothetical protein K1719_000215 [Acacia pycnantha]|nr:hypothetical protein K1719_000215 [Acacia pycnantha]
MDFQFSECKEHEAPLLSGLIGFLSYCKGVIFETHDPRSPTDDSEGRCSTKKMISGLNPEDFLCLILLEVMTDPVTVSIGHTYDLETKLSQNRGKVEEHRCNPEHNTPKAYTTILCRNGVSLTKLNNQSRDLSKAVLPGSPLAIFGLLLHTSTFNTFHGKNTTLCGDKGGGQYESWGLGVSAKPSWTMDGRNHGGWYHQTLAAA